jgi:hypothetical protein
MQYLLGIPFANREDLLRRAIESVKPLWRHTVIVDNSETGLIPSAWPTEVIAPHVPLSFSQTMNLLQRLAAQRGCDVLFYMHNDAEPGSGTPERLLAAVEEALVSRPRWGVAFTHYDALAAANMAMVRDVGPWDTNLPQYFSDNDYYRRIRLAGWEVMETGLPVTHLEGGSSTIKSDARRLLLNSVTFPLYERYYVVKWGGPPERETYRRAFNGAL